MRAAAQFARKTDVEHAHGIAVLLAEQRHRAALDGVVVGHDLGLCGLVGQYLGIDDGFHAGDLLGRHGRVVREVEAGLVGVDQRAALLHVGAQHFAQGLVHQVRGRVVAHRAGATHRIHARQQGIADLQRAGLERAVMAEHAGLDLEGVGHREPHAASLQQAGVAHLAAGLGIERGGIEHHDRVLARRHLLDLGTLDIQRRHLDAAQFEVLVAFEARLGAFVAQALGHLELARGARLLALALHRRLEAGHVHLDLALATDVGGEINRKAVGVVQREQRGAVERVALGDLGQRAVQDLHAVFERFAEAFFFLAQHLRHALGHLGQLGIGFAHLGHQVRHQAMEERLGLAQLVAMAQGAAHNAAQHVAAAFVAGNDAVDDEKGASADVIGDDLRELSARSFTPVSRAAAAISFWNRSIS